jgi:ribosomal protein S18 acetylase RimI-like enzyme
MIRSLEELSFNAWPALQTVYYDGWLLRFANGYTRRANSVNSIYPSSLAVQEKIEACEAVYSARGQDTVFKISPAVLPANLDALLERHGYRQEAITSVQTLDLKDLVGINSFAARVVLSNQVTNEWLVAFCTLNNIPDRRLLTITGMLKAIVPATAYVALQIEQEIVAVGLAVREREFVGLFDIVTAASWRQRGLGAHLIGTLLAWGREGGAQTAYLQVMLDNAPALALYRKFGFAEAYRYWYRVRSV